MKKTKIAGLALFILGVMLMGLGIRQAKATPSPVYIFKTLAENTYTQENLRILIKSKYAFIISLCIVTDGGETQWINFSSTDGSPSYKADAPIEIPLGKKVINNEWQPIEILDLEAILAPGGANYHYLKKIGIRGPAFQLGKVELFSGSKENPFNLQVITSFDNPDITEDITKYGWYTNNSKAGFSFFYPTDGGYLEVEGETSKSTSSSNSGSSGNNSPTNYNTGNSFINQGYNTQSWYDQSRWGVGTGVYQPYIPPLPSMQPLFGFGYPPNSPPFGFGPQPFLQLLGLTGLPAYYTSQNPGYPYSAGGYNFSTLFATGASPYPYASTFPEQTYPYLVPAAAQLPPTYNIYTSPLTSTLAPTTAIISGITTTFGGGLFGGGGIGAGGGGLI